MAENAEATPQSGSLTPKDAGSKIATLLNPTSETPAKQDTSKQDQSEQDQDQQEEENEEVSNKRLKKDQTPEADNDDQEIEDVEGDDTEEDEDSEDDLDLEDGEDGDNDDTEDDSEEYSEDDMIEIPTKDGKTEKVTADELIKGYMRTKDYTQKTQDLAEQRKSVEAIQDEISDLPQVRKTYQDNAKQLLDTSTLVLNILDKTIIPNEPKAELLSENAEEYIRQKEARQGALDLKQSLLGVMQKVKKDNDILLEQQINESGQKLMREYSVLKDDAEQSKLRGYIKTAGYTDEQINKHADHRTFIWAHKAMKYDALMEKRKNLKPKAKKVKTIKSKKAREEQGSIVKRKRTKAVKAHKNARTVKSAGNAIAESIMASQRRNQR